MAMDMSSSQREMVHEQHPVMPADLFLAAIKGDRDVIIQRLGLLIEQKEVKETIKASHYAPQQIKTEHRTVQSEFQSATCFGDTILHLLVIKRHNELAFRVFQRDMSLLKAQNKMLETPLHCAAKVGNEEVIQMLIRNDPANVKDVLQETNEKGDTALHIAIRYDFKDISIKLMELDPKVAYKVNNEMLTPLYLAIEEERDSIAENMLKLDPTLACTQFFDGTFPVHLAARKGNLRLVRHFMEKYPDYAELVDPHGRNFLHIAAQDNKESIFSYESISELDMEVNMEVRMNDATDYEGNTPMHIAAMKGHMETLKAIWEIKMYRDAETLRNKRGLTPYEVSKRQQEEKFNENCWIKTPSPTYYYELANGAKFSEEWFNYIMYDDKTTKENKWERTQVIGLGSVLITTVTFAAAFTIPGGFNQDNGTPVLGRRYMFWAFILANALSCIQGSLSLFALLLTALPGIHIVTFKCATILFMLAGTSMLTAFGFGLYVMLAPVCLPIAILLLVITLCTGSPALLVVFLRRERYIQMVTNLVLSSLRAIVATYIVSLLLIFCLSLLYL